MKDELVRGLALDGRVRFMAAVTTGVGARLVELHKPTPPVAAALCRVATGALLLASALEKTSGKEPMVTLEIDGDGPAGRFIATASPAGWVRATVANPRAWGGDGSVASVVGTSGQLIVTRDLGFGEPYRGVTRLVSGEVAKDLAWHLAESEQVPSAVVLGARVGGDGKVEHAAGLLVQALPGLSDGEADDLAGRVLELGGLTERMLAGEGIDQWLELLFPGGYELLGRYPVFFRCGCSKEKAVQAVRLLGDRELGDGEIKVRCEFCNRTYSVTKADIEAMAESR